MTFIITKGMAGRKVELIGKYSCDEIDKMHIDFIEWKKNNHSKYRIASYERQLIDDNNHKIIIDFGDYSYFGLIKANKKEWQALQEYQLHPTNLEV